MTVKETTGILESFLEKLLDYNNCNSWTEEEIKHHEREDLADAENAETDAQKAREEADWYA